MFLTKEEEAILDGEKGPGMQKAMELLAAMGDIKGAEKLVPVSSVHVSGVSYKTIGDAGLEFLKELADTGVGSRVLATLNPAGIDLEDWGELGFPEPFASRQLEIVDAYERMGILPTCTCTPYLAGNLPGKGEIVSWAESSAVVFGNSVLGVRTNRESGVLALASALVGKTPYYGLHLSENRVPSIKVKVGADLRSEADYSALGFYVGKHFPGLPVFQGISPGMDDLKALSAGLGVGSVDMFSLSYDGSVETVSFGREELREVYEELNTAEEADLVCVGCPHCSLREVHAILGRRPGRDTWIFTGRHGAGLFQGEGRVRIVKDTCMVVAPLEELGIESIGVNSAKAAFYASHLSDIKVRFDAVENLLR
jgi:hypothetical protein